MKRSKPVGRIFLSLSLLGYALGQTTTNPNSGTVPRLIRFSGVLKHTEGHSVIVPVSLSISLYPEQIGGAPLWTEIQAVTPDAHGRYSLLLGSTKPDGLPIDLFASGETRWLGVQVSGEPEQPRVLLLSVPYALKAADADTVGGLPPSAFARVLQRSTTVAATESTAKSGSYIAASGVSGSGTANYVPLWTGRTRISNSNIFQGSAQHIGIGTNMPAATLDVNGPAFIRGRLQLPSLGTANANSGFNSQPLNFQASAFNSSIGTALNQTFQWQAEPLANNTSAPAGTLNLLFGSGTSVPVETGLKISNTGVFTFAPGQTFIGAAPFQQDTVLSQNPTPATAIMNQSAPRVELIGNIWNGTASVPDTWFAGGSMSPPNGTVLGSALLITHTGPTIGQPALGIKDQAWLIFSPDGSITTPDQTSGHPGLVISMANGLGQGGYIDLNNPGDIQGPGQRTEISFRGHGQSKFGLILDRQSLGNKDFVIRDQVLGASRIYINGAGDVFIGGQDAESATPAVTVLATGAVILNNGPRILTGTGVPMVAAPVGSVYLRTDGGTGTTLYVKESGIDNGGWVAK